MGSSYRVQSVVKSLMRFVVRPEKLYNQQFQSAFRVLIQIIVLILSGRWSQHNDRWEFRLTGR